MLAKKYKNFLFFVVLTLLLLSSTIQNVSASDISDEVDVEGKIGLYKLDMIDDTLKSGTNEVTYHWTDMVGVSRSVDLIVTVNEDGDISSVKEKNISSPEEFSTIKVSIENKDSGITIQATNPQVPYKLNGGTTRSQFVNDHAFDRHKFEKNATSNCSRSRYDKNVGVASVRNSTIKTPDEKWSTRFDSAFSTIYIKRFTGSFMNMRMSDYGFTNYHRVIANHDNPSRSTHHPYCY